MIKHEIAPLLGFDEFGQLVFGKINEWCTEYRILPKSLLTDVCTVCGNRFALTAEELGSTRKHNGGYVHNRCYRAVQSAQEETVWRACLYAADIRFREYTEIPNGYSEHGPPWAIFAFPNFTLRWGRRKRVWELVLLGKVDRDKWAQTIWGKTENTKEFHQDKALLHVWNVGEAVTALKEMSLVINSEDK
jgi:hypothetical protein